MAGVLGFGLGVGVGAHIGNGMRGSLAADMVGGAVVGNLFARAAVSGDPDTVGLNPAAALDTILTTVIIERTSAGTRYRRRQMSLGFAPAAGGLRVALRTTF